VRDITRLLTRWGDGDQSALGELMPVVYGEMRKLADSYMRQERRDHTLQPTALVHEAFLRLAETRRVAFENRVHFYGAAAQAMRRILVDYARSHLAEKRGHGSATVDLDQASDVGIDVRVDLVALDEALDGLAAVAPRPAKVVELRYFGGMSIDETAAFLDIAPATVKRHWAFARSWLYRALRSA
jgi:RNA polymerase sigma-70 factor (ECF subfamily)